MTNNTLQSLSSKWGIAAAIFGIVSTTAILLKMYFMDIKDTKIHELEVTISDLKSEASIKDKKFSEIRDENRDLLLRIQDLQGRLLSMECITEDSDKNRLTDSVELANVGNSGLSVQGSTGTTIHYEREKAEEKSVRIQKVSEWLDEYNNVTYRGDRVGYGTKLNLARQNKELEKKFQDAVLNYVKAMAQISKTCVHYLDKDLKSRMTKISDQILSIRDAAVASSLNTPPNGVATIGDDLASKLGTLLVEMDTQVPEIFSTQFTRRVMPDSYG
jgi:hypothetical protein